MTKFLKITAALALLASLGACTVVPPQVAYSGPSVGIVTVAPAPYYRPAPYYYAPAPYYRPPAYRPWRGPGHGNGYGHGDRHW